MVRLSGFIPAVCIMLSSCAQAQETEEQAVSGETYAECVTRILEPSLAIMDRMTSQGLDWKKDRLITHLLVGTDNNVAKAAAFAEQKGYDITERTRSRLLITEKAPVIEDWIKHTIPGMCSFADEFGLTYDGWDVDVSDEELKRK